MQLGCQQQNSFVSDEKLSFYLKNCHLKRTKLQNQTANGFRKKANKVSLPIKRQKG